MKPRVIVFEDDDHCRKLVTIVLEQQGYEVISYSSPTFCPPCSNLDEACPHEDVCGDFFLTDYNMPGMTGLEFIESQVRRGCKGMVNNKAVISAGLTQNIRRKAEELGCKIFSKPYKFREIVKWLDERKKTISPHRKLSSVPPDPMKE